MNIEAGTPVPALGVARPSVHRPFDHELLWGILSILMLAAAWLMPAALLRSGPSFCIFRIATGFPCYLCGGTRAMHAFTHGDLAHAWSMNPLATVIGFLAAVFLPYAAVAVATGRRWRPRPARPRLALAALAVVLLAAAVANWCYLIHVGR